MQTQLAMRELSLDEIEAVSGGAEQKSFWDRLNDAFEGLRSNLAVLAAGLVEILDQPDVRWTDPETVREYGLDCQGDANATYVGNLTDGSPIWECRA